ncbi:MAG TPA: VOC family protein [Blastocatellia bacterium]|nr:VOC family protein [Blastocatellia bacterium]
MRIVGLDHIQLAIPRDTEEQARAFYGDVLGLEELPKPPELAGRGGVWFQCGGQQLHLGVEDDFHPARKAHPGILIENIETLALSLRTAGYEPVWDGSLPQIKRIFVADPFGNRLEFLERT